jgi:hypothetical protein
MIEGQEVMEISNSPNLCCPPTKAVLSQTYMGVFFIRSVSDTIFAMLFLPKLPLTTVQETLAQATKAYFSDRAATGTGINM